MILIKAVLKSRAWKIGLLGPWVEALFIFRRDKKKTIMESIGDRLLSWFKVLKLSGVINSVTMSLITNILNMMPINLENLENGLLGPWVEALFIFRRDTKTTIVKNIGTYLTAIRANDEWEWDFPLKVTTIAEMFLRLSFQMLISWLFFSGYWLIPNFISLLVNGITTFGRSTLNQVAQLDSRKRLEK